MNTPDAPASFDAAMQRLSADLLRRDADAGLVERIEAGLVAAAAEADELDELEWEWEVGEA